MSRFPASIFSACEQIAEVFTSHLIEDRGVIITTHEIQDIEHLIDKAVLLEDGVVRMEFLTEEMREKEGKSRRGRHEGGLPTMTRLFKLIQL